MSAKTYLDDKDFSALVIAGVQSNTLTEHIHGPMNVLDAAIKQIITKQFVIKTEPFKPCAITKNTTKQREINTIAIEGTFTDVKMEPFKSPGPYGTVKPLDPAYCIEQGTTYRANIKLSGQIKLIITYLDGTVDDKNVTEFKDLNAMEIPIEVGNKFCVQNASENAFTREQIYGMRSDPDIFDGLFIISGQLYAVLIDEKLKFNGPQFYYDIHGNQVGRSVILMREGIYRNSYQMITLLLKNGMITTEITTNPYKDRPIPFVIFFYLLGFTRDDEIEEMILMNNDEQDVLRVSMQQVIQQAILEARKDPKFAAPMNMSDPDEVAWWLVRYTHPERSANMMIEEKRARLSDLWRFIDENFMVHQTAVGSGDYATSPSNLRAKKARMYGMILHDLILTVQQKDSSTDRDHPAGKRFHTAGHQMTQVIKRHFNVAIVSELRKVLQETLEKTPVESVSIASIVKRVFEQARVIDGFNQEFRSGNDTITVKTKTIKRTICREPIAPLKSRTYLSSLRGMVHKRGLQSKEGIRSTQIRMVHPAFAGFLDPVTSPDTGENVGMPTQLSILTTITNFEDISFIRDMVLKYEGLVHYNDISSANMKTFTLIYINGDWYGGLERPHEFVTFLREQRRRSLIDKSVAIVYNTRNDRVDIWTDEGRLMAPFIVVYNNAVELDAYDDETAKMSKDKWPERIKNRPQFKQEIRYTREHEARLIRGEIEFSDLFGEGILEWISTEEYVNCIVAHSHKHLWEYRHNEAYKYTHLFIPHNMFCLTALLATMPTTSDPTRHCFFTNMGKQTNCFISPNQRYFEQKQMSSQMVAYHPLAPTPGMQIIEHGGGVVQIAFKCDATNQEDSLNFNEGFILRNGFLSTNFNNISAECKSADERFGTPLNLVLDQAKGNRSKLDVDGVVPEGAFISEGDIVISRYYTKKMPGGQVREIDASVVYSNHEDAYVSRVKRSEGDKSRKITVYYHIIRRPNKGSKFSSLSGNKGVISRIIPESLVPYDVFTGRKPDFIVNTHSFPSRMIGGELLSDLIGEIAAMKGIMIPIAPFMEIDLRDLIKMAGGIKQNPFGLKAMRDPRSGALCKALFLTISYRQCLQKFAEAEASARLYGKLSMVTRNSLAGAANNGGMKAGEMELWTIAQHGTALKMNSMQADDKSTFNLPVCSVCGNLAIYNAEKGISICKLCGGKSKIQMSNSKYMTDSFLHYINGMGIEAKLRLEPFTNDLFDTFATPSAPLTGLGHSVPSS